MNTGTKDKPRLGYADGGKIQCMADGGLISSLVKKLTTPAAVVPVTSNQTPEPSQGPATTGQVGKAMGSIRSRNQVLEDAEKNDVGMKKGGPVKGPGGPTDDQVPIMASDGEFMIKAAAVQKLGVPTLEALNAVADGDAKPKLGKVKRKRRGKRKGYRDGGLIEEETRRRVAPYVNHRAPSGPPAMPPLQLGNSVPPPGSTVATTPYKPNFTMGGTPPAAAPVEQVSDVRAKYNPANGSPEAKAYQASRAAPAPVAVPAPATTPTAAPSTRLGRIASTASRFAAPAGAAMAAIPEVVDTASVAMNPQASGIDVATQAAQGLGRIGAAGAGAAGGAALGAMTGPLAPIAVPLGAIAGGALGYFGADKAIEAGRTAVGVDPRAPAQRLETTPANQLPANVTVTPARPQGFAPVPVPVAAPAAPAPVLGQVQRVGNSYSGQNVAGDIAVNGAAPRGGFVRGSGDGTFGYGGANSGGNDAALFDARKAALARGDVDSVKASYGGNFGPKVDPIDALINNGRPMTARKAAAIAQLQSAKAQAEGSTADRALNTAKFGVEKEAADLTNREKKGLLSAQDAYANAKTPAEKVAAEDRLRAMQGKYEKAPPDEYAGIAGGQDANGNRTDPLIYSKRTGERKEQPTSTTATPRAQYDTLKKGEKYIGTDGKQYIKG